MHRSRLAPTRLGTAALAALAVAACDAPMVTPVAPELEPQMGRGGGGDGGDLERLIEEANVELAEEGMQIVAAEWMGAPGHEGMGNTVFFNDRGNKQLGHHFVPGDPRRGGGTDITYAQDGAEAATSSGLAAAQTLGAIDAAMATWNGQQCSTIPLTNLGVAPFDIGFVQSLLGFGGFPGVFADVTHSGFLPGAFFDALAPGGSGFILGVTFTFIFVDANGPTDVDNNGKLDTAFRDIYYNDNFFWSIGANIDVETVALHEAGHGLSQAHFGKLHRTNKNGKLHFSPQAVMNAGYTQVQQTPLGTDNGGHCSIWGSWPNN